MCGLGIRAQAGERGNWGANPFSSNQSVGKPPVGGGRRSRSDAHGERACADLRLNLGELC